MLNFISLRTKIYFQRSWNLYRKGYGTLTLSLHSPFTMAGVAQFNLFHWWSPVKGMTNTDFRFDIFRKFKDAPPHKGFKGCLKRSIYAYWDYSYPTGVRLYPYLWWQQLLGRLCAEYIIRFY